MEQFTVIVPFYNGHKTIERLISTLPDEAPVIIVDDQSDVPLQLNRDDIEVIRPNVKGYFTGAVNAGAEQCETDFLVLNQDTWFEGTAWLDLLAANRDRYALIGEGISGVHPAWPYGYVHGTFMFVRRDAWETVGPMNVRDYPLWGSTCEWQLRAARKGFRALPITPIPGFQHERKKGERYGSSIKQILKGQPDKQDLLIRTPPAISVVINCYNQGRFLPDAVNSLIGGPTSLGHMKGQTFQSFEVIIVDDGSTDETQEIGQDLADRWKGVRYIRQSNAGSASACNTGIRHAYGRYIAPLDSDDMMTTDRLEVMYRKQLSHPHGVVFDDLLTFTNGHIHIDGSGKHKVWSMPTYDFHHIVWKNTMHKGLMYPKKAWEDVGGYAEIMNKGREDWAFNVGLGRLGWCGHKANVAGYLYRRSDHNRTLTNTTPTWRQHFLGQLQSLYPDVYQGRYPVGCCGGNKAKVVKTASSSKRGARAMANMANMPGVSGMVKVEFHGLNVGNVTYWGPVTNTRYIFGGKRRIGYVDERDFAGLTSMYKGGTQLFTEVIDDEPAPAIVETEYVPEDVGESAVPVSVVETVPLPEPDEELSPQIDYTQYSVRELREMLPGLPRATLERVYEEESATVKPRVSVLKLVTKLLND